MLRPSDSLVVALDVSVANEGPEGAGSFPATCSGEGAFIRCGTGLQPEPNDASSRSNTCRTQAACRAGRSCKSREKSVNLQPGGLSALICIGIMAAGISLCLPQDKFSGSSQQLMRILPKSAAAKSVNGVFELMVPTTCFESLGLGRLSYLLENRPSDLIVEDVYRGVSLSLCCETTYHRRKPLFSSVAPNLFYKRIAT